MKTNHKYITNPVFIISLILLLTNDFYLKEVYHNWVTGKLSDLAGVIVFSLFLTSVRSDLKAYIFTLTAISFAFWKTEYCQPLIEYWNALGILKLERIIDYSDILCLSVLVPLYRYQPNSEFLSISYGKILRYPIALITLFAILATSRARHIPTDIVYVNEFVKVNSTEEYFLNQLDNDNINYTLTNSIFVVEKDTLKRMVLENIVINDDTIREAEIGLLDKNDHLRIYVKTLSISNGSNHHPMSLRAYKKWARRYKIEINRFLIEIIE